jgi:hypothetical protein
LSNPNRLPSPLPPSPGGSPVPPRVRPRLGPAHDVLSSRGPGRLTAVPPSGLDPLGTLGFLGRVTSWIRHRPTTSATRHDPRTRPRIPIPACSQPTILRLPTAPGRARTPHSGGRPDASEPRRPSVAADPDPPNHPSTLRRRPALSRTGSGPRSLSGQPRPRLPHRGANHDVKRRDQVPSLISHPRRFSVGGFGPRCSAPLGATDPDQRLCHHPRRQP